MAVAVVQVEGTGDTGTTGEENVGRVIAVGVGDGEAAAEGVHAVGQEGLANHVVERNLSIGVVDTMRRGDFLEETFVDRTGSDGDGGTGLGGRFGDDQAMVGGQVGEVLLVSAGPLDGEPTDAGKVA